jgi:amidase
MAIADRATGADLAFAGLAGQAERVRAGDVSARELTELSLERIHRLDRHLNAFRVVLDEQALAEADQADARRRAGDDRPLLGVPIAIKDDQDVRGEITGMGTLANLTPRGADSEIVRRLRAAGAVVVGKTNVPELLAFPWSETTAHGSVRNPWDPARTPGGSSGGSAAAVAAGLVAAATASDGAGSIRIPAGCTGLVGLKPQRDRIPYKPVGEGWHGLSVVGVVTRTVADCAFVYEVLTGEPYAAAAAAPPAALKVALSYAIPPGLMAKVDPEVRRGTEATAAALREAGHTVVERDPDYGLASLNWGARYLRGIADDAASLAHPERLDQRSRGLARLGRLIPEPLFAAARDGAEADRRRIEAQIDDVLMLPVFNRLPSQIGEFEGLGAVRSLDRAFNHVPFTGGFNHTGMPAIAVPVQLHDGFPVAVQFVGRQGSEARLLALAAQLEDAIGWPGWIPPGFQ